MLAVSSSFIFKYIWWFYRGVLLIPNLGSYGGFLAAIFRLNYPQVFFGSIAAAAPVRSFFNIPNPARYNWWEWVSLAYNVLARNFDSGSIYYLSTLDLDFKLVSTRICRSGIEDQRRLAGF